MKIRIILFAALATLFISCKKSTTPAPATTANYYIKLKINGAAKSMTMTPMVMFTNAQPLYMCQLSGYFPNNFGQGATFTITDAAAIVTNKTYTQQIINAGGTQVIQTVFVYRGDDGKQYLAEGNIPGTLVSVQFSEIATDHVKGTFSGTVQIQGTSTFVAVTDGEFYLNRVQL
ncbi:MAG: hypothetical protein JST19_08110 [Bacteroidetes bacterium]|nr:hypothetical protein [Bacteroidota bacterium]